MTAIHVITVALQGFCACILLVTFGYLRKAARYNKITRKIRAHEPLTPREQHLMDKARVAP